MHVSNTLSHIHTYVYIFRGVGKFSFFLGVCVLFKVRWIMGLLHNKTWMTGFACHVLVANLHGFLPSVNML